MLTILSFLGGNVFRLMFGEIVAYFQRKQEYANELARMTLQGELDAATHARNLEALRLQAELQVKEIVLKAEARADELDGIGFNQAVADIGKSTGILFLDVWNGAIRPALATLAFALVVFEAVRNGFVLSDWDRELIGAILGIYVADRALARRGK